MMLRSLLCVALCISLVSADSCAGRCGDGMNAGYNCQCNSVCYQYDDCCGDFNNECGYTCTSAFCDEYFPSKPCQCNDLCEQYGNCCADRQEVCFGSTTTSATGVTGATTTAATTTTTTTAATTTTTTVAVSDSCSGRCDASLDSSKNCQCNTACSNYGDCCADYESVCQGGSGGSGGNTGNCAAVSVTTTELQSISKQMWGSNTNNFPYDSVQYNIQGQTTTSATNDVAPAPFFTMVDETLFNGDTFQKLRALQDNYIKTQGITEVVTSEELAENQAFIDAVMDTNVGMLLFDFLDSKNLAGCNGTYGFKTILNDIWFGMYDRLAPDDTSGFEHSFVGEIKGSGVSGFHNWMNFYYEELDGQFNYQGYINTGNPRMVGMRHTWYGATKPMNGFTIGTSPEIEFGLYTLCFLAKPGSKCPIVMGDENGNDVDGSIQTYVWSKENAPGGQHYIASAYFIS